MSDVAPELLNTIQKSFNKNFNKNKNIDSVYKKVRDGTATYTEVNEFALEVGRALSEAMQSNLSSDILPNGKLYYNIADRIIPPMLKKNYDIVTEVALQVQNTLNKEAGIGIRAVKPELNADRIVGIVDIVSEKEKYDDVADLMGEAVINFTQSVVDDTVRVNADFQYRVGLSPKIVRRSSGKCCEWCARLVGTYDYESVSDTGNDVFRRHKNCRCTVEYVGKGIRENVHTKQWQIQKEHDKIEARKIIGLVAEDDAIMQDIRKNIIPKQNLRTIVERQQIHRIGTDLYEVRKQELEKRGEFGPSYITVSDEKIIELVKKYSGKGKIRYNRKGEWTSQETIITNEEIIGVVIDNRNGNSAETSVFKIHYAKDGIHIVPDYPSKRR